jgi:hypothetical protein
MLAYYKIRQFDINYEFVMFHSTFHREVLSNVKMNNMPHILYCVQIKCQIRQQQQEMPQGFCILHLFYSGKVPMVSLSMFPINSKDTVLNSRLERGLVK